MNKPDVIYVFSDQHRACACGYAGDPNVKTPNIDALSRESVSFTNAVSGMPVCCPYRASFITGQYPLTHGVFVNDVCLSNDAVSIAQAYKSAGYDTAYIGKWHIDGHGRQGYIPPERRHGFDYWKVLECSHDYNHSPYYDNNDETLRYWEGYNAFAQTDDAIKLLKSRKSDKPLFLVLSWGAPHNPYNTAPREFADMYDSDKIICRPNVPPELIKTAQNDLAGYYAHISALDSCVGRLSDTIRALGKEENTLFVYTSDHGDMLCSHGEVRKQKPWDESILVPFLLKYPALFGGARRINTPINSPDIMPTLLDICGITIPETVEGKSALGAIMGDVQPRAAAKIECIHPFGEYHRGAGGREYRGIRTERYTYARTLDGDWLLYDNKADPYQMNNLADDDSCADIKSELKGILADIMAEQGDRFLPGMDYVNKWGYPVDETQTVPYH